MSYELADSLDHAILAEAIRHGSEAADSKTLYLGRTALQKIMYFLKVAGVPLTYTFDIYHYGPFCQEVMSDVSSLLVEEIIEDRSKKPEYSKYGPGRLMEDFRADWDAKIAPHREKISRISRALSGVHPNELELVATLDFIHRELRLTNPAAEPSREAVMRRFVEVKGEKFSVDQVQKTYDMMRASGMILR